MLVVMQESVAGTLGDIQDGGKFGVRLSLPRIFSTKLLDGNQDNLDLFDACQRSKSAPNMKNLRPIWTIRIRSSSMILRKCRTEKPASSAALGISKKVLFVLSASVIFISVLRFGGRICIWVAVHSWAING